MMAAEGGRGDAVASEAEAALLSGAALFFGGGCYEQKVVPLGWDASGRLCASAGGRHLVVWDMGAAGSPPPVRENGRSLLLGHTASVSWLGFKLSRRVRPRRRTARSSLASHRTAGSSCIG